MDEHITREELDRVLAAHPGGQRDKNSNWRGRMEKIKAGEPLVLYPTDHKHAHSLDTTARSYARYNGIKIKIRKVEQDGQLKLFVFLA
ncbi:hypothetical protein LCGC14_3081580 [marine sediment metagenome]|uniref:Uncharacterized protein n=1 Tax=marine sediment metagenome TaxID=412755 RepID=A0A0F8WDY4_9ZZZZ